MKFEFFIPYHTFFGQTVALSGSCPELGAWEESKAVFLNWSQNDKSDHLWSILIDLPPNFEYKYLVRYSASANTLWERNRNRRIQAERLIGKVSADTIIEVQDLWEFPDQSGINLRRSLAPHNQQSVMFLHSAQINRSIAIPLRDAMTVGDLKTLLKQQGNLYVDDILLISSGGQKLENNAALLKDYKIEAGSTVHFITKQIN